MLFNNISLFSLICFIDNFEFYRNMYCLLFEVYLTLTRFIYKNCQKTLNSYSIILDSHDFNINNVIEVVQYSFVQLEHSYQLSIKN